MPKTLSGLAITPRVSVNKTFYFPEELAKFDGKTVPLRLETHKTGKVIGEATFRFDSSNGQVRYEAVITDKEGEDFLEANPNVQVSIGASVLRQNHICHPTGSNCYYAPVLNEPTELAIVKNPGIPESTGIYEHIITTDNTSSNTFTITTDTPRFEILEEIEECPTKCEQITSNKDIIEEKTMVEETPKTVETSKATEVTESAKPVENQTSTNEVVESVLQKIEESNERTMKAIVEESKKIWTPKSEVAESTTPQGFVEKAFTEEEAKTFINGLFDRGYGRLIVNKEGWIDTHKVAVTGTHGDVQEAISTSGTIPGVVQSQDISIQLGSKTAKPIRQYGMFQAIPTGQNTARFYRISVPDAGAITESPTTDITAATHTLTSIDVTCNIRGWRQTVEKAELENFPAAFLNALRETARLEAIRDEHKLIVQDLASTARDFGGTTTAPYHISGSDGTAVTTATLEDAAGEFDEDGITFAKRFLEQLGQDTSPGNLIAFIAPRAFESLITSSGLTNYTQIGFANVTRLGQMEQLFGCDIVVTNELLTNANAYRNLVCVKGKAWALASQREMEIEFQKLIKGQYWDVVWTHRIGVNVVDPNTYVIVSSIQA